MLENDRTLMSRYPPRAARGRGPRRLAGHLRPCWLGLMIWIKAGACKPWYGIKTTAKGYPMYKHVLVPVSFDDERDSAGALAVATRLAGDDGRISLLHVIEQVPNYAISYLPEGYREQAREAVQTELSRMAAALRNASAHVVEGHSARTILDWAEKHEPDCIVIASHRPGMQDMLLGSTAAKVVRHAVCAVHVIR